MLRRMYAVFTVLLIIYPVISTAGERPWTPFYGSYAGRGSATVAGELRVRDLSVKIAAAQKGFTVEWTTVIRKLDGRVKRKQYKIRFIPTPDRHLFSSAMRVNMFGKAVPLDPMQGEPYVWATIRGDEMTVHALELTDQYGYEMQTYRRTLTADGLSLKFSRVRDGERLRDVQAELIRVPE